MVEESKMGTDREADVRRDYAISRRRFMEGAGIVAAGILSMGLIGCGSSSSGSSGSAGSSGSTAASDATLNFGCTNFSKESIDPSNKVNAAWCCTRYGIAECLFRFDDTMQPQPQLCDTYTVDDGHTTWKFHIKDGIKFSTGEALTATKVVESIEYMFSQEAAGNGSSKPSMYMKYSSIEADDASSTVTIVTGKAYADLCAELAHPFFCIIDIKGSPNIAEMPIGTGPYAVTEFNTGQNIILARNENYWDGTVPYQTLNILFIDDSSSLTKTMALQAGNVDVVENITSTSDLETLRNNSAYKVSETIGMRCGFSYLNQSGILANKDLRTAILMAVDDDTICNKTVGGMYSPGCSVLPSSLSYNYDKLTDATPYNVEKAKQILDAAGITDSDGDGWRELNGAVINLDYVTYDSRNLAVMAEAVSAELKEIGIQATVTKTDADTEWNRLVAGDYDMNSSNWMTVQDGDPYGYLANWYSKSDSNYCAYKNDKYDTLYDQLGTTLDASKRVEIIQQLQQILIDDSAVLVHGYYHSNLCSNTATVSGADISMADYYWITTDFKPVA